MIPEEVLGMILEVIPEKSQKKVPIRMKLSENSREKFWKDFQEEFPRNPEGVSRGVLDIVGIQVGIQDEDPDRISEDVPGGIQE